jgi:hypothetical protein
MKTVNNDVFLSKISQRIKNGDFDTYLTLPFMTRHLLHITIKSKLDKKLETGGTPILSDNEIKDCLADVKETALNIILCYIKNGFMVRTETGLEFTEKGHKIFRVAMNSKS